MIWSFLVSKVSLSTIRGWRRPYFSSILAQILVIISAIPLLPSLVLGNALKTALLAVGK
jgi:K+-transporting ATPase A subunit